MTAKELKHYVDQTGSHFFDLDSMIFFGDSMRNYGVRGPHTIVDTRERQRTVYELYRKRAVLHGVKDSAYFDATTFERVYPLDRA